MLQNVYFFIDQFDTVCECVRVCVCRHIVFAPSAFDMYAGALFPGLVDLLWRIEDTTGDEQARRWQQVKRHLATVIYTVHSASSVLRDTGRFDKYTTRDKSADSAPASAKDAGAA